MTSPGSLAPPRPWTLFAAGEDSGSKPASPRRSPARWDRSGSILGGQWELLRRLGHGGMGEVYESFYRADRRRYALKLMIADERGDPVAETRFRHEFMVLRQVELPGLVRAHALYEIDGELFYTMELLEGRDLEALIKERPLPPWRVLEIGIALTRTLEGLHERGIIHRDIKPTNVVELAGGEIRLVDLGIGKLLPPFYAASGEGRTPPEERLQTRPGVWLGTPGYIAPEAGYGEPPAPRQDVFSLGVTLFRLATRHFPFPEGGVPGALTEPRAAAQLGVDLPQAVETVLRRAMIVEPAHRIQTMVALRTELEDALAELDASGEVAPRDTRRTPPDPSAPRSRARSTAFIAALCVATTASGVLVGKSLAGRGDRSLLPLVFEIGRALRGLVVEAAVGEEDERPSPSSENERPSASTRSHPEDMTTHGEREPTTSRAAVVTAPRPRATRPLPTMRAALRAADARFRRCAAVVEGSFFVEFTVEDGGTSFASANPIYETDPELLRCVQRVASSLRFTPTPRQIFVEEYKP